MVPFEYVCVLFFAAGGGCEGVGDVDGEHGSVEGLELFGFVFGGAVVIGC